MYAGESSETRARRAWSEKTAEAAMTSFYLTRPKMPLAAALSQMLRRIETELAEEKLEAVDERRLCRRAELIRALLVPRLMT